MSKLATVLTGIEGERIALSDVSVFAVLSDLLSEVTVSQTYRNDENRNIEAVYTFPLPLDAVLLELRVELGGRILDGVVVEKHEAEEQYEDAVAGGDSAVMLAEIEPGLHTMNVGNLLPGETARITFKYAILYRWSGDRLRFLLPTTVAPRYGESPHRPHETTEVSLTVENRFSLQVEIFGSLRDAQFDCPSHPVSLARSGEKAVLSLDQVKAVMDRDFVLNVKAPQAAHSFALCGADGEGVAALASFQPFFPGLRQHRPLNLAIVIDCSGSMAGGSIEQAKAALDRILATLQSHDRMTIIAFGSTVRLLSGELVPCNEANLAQAEAFARDLDANLGGTDIEGALDKAYEVLNGVEAADIFLVTDGEVSQWEPVVRNGRKAGHRIFTVGVGNAVSEAFVRRLASATGGGCELVSPREGMAERVVRHFERMRAPRARRVAIRWPEGAVDVAPIDLGAVFEGDTVVACARFERPSDGGTVLLEVETEQGDLMRHELTFAMPTPDAATDPVSTVARVAAALRMKETNEAAGRAIALRYRLVSPWTNWLVLAERAEGEKAQDMPALRKVPQTLAAGWAGVGSAPVVWRSPRAAVSVPVLHCAASAPCRDIYAGFREASGAASEPESRDTATRSGTDSRSEDGLMSESIEIDGPTVVNWLAASPDERTSRLVGAEFVDDYRIWRIVSAHERNLQLECADSGHRKTVQFQGLAEGSLYFKPTDPIPAEIDAEKSPFELLAKKAQAYLRQSGLIGRGVLSDTEAVRLMKTISRWLTERRPPSAEQLDEAADLLERFKPATRAACSLFGEWLDAIIDSSARKSDEATFRIHYASLLRAANNPAEAVAVTDPMLNGSMPHCSDRQRAILLTIRAAALMDLYERERNATRLTEAERRLKNAWAIEAGNQFLVATYRRFESLKAAARGT